MGYKCSHCGNEYDEQSNFCPYCGTPKPNGTVSSEDKPVPKKGKKKIKIIAGVVAFLIFCVIVYLLDPESEESSSSGVQQETQDDYEVYLIASVADLVLNADNFMGMNVSVTGIAQVEDDTIWIGDNNGNWIQVSGTYDTVPDNGDTITVKGRVVRDLIIGSTPSIEATSLEIGYTGGI